MPGGVGDEPVVEPLLGPAHQVVDRAEHGHGVVGGDRGGCPTDRAACSVMSSAIWVASPAIVAVDQPALLHVGGEREGDERLLLAGERGQQAEN